METYCYKDKGVWFGKPKYEPRTRCRFYDEEQDECEALKCVYCEYEKEPCNFYKPRKDNE